MTEEQGASKMEKYEQLAIVGEGSYGLVMKCRHRESDQVVAIKKFLETEEDATVRRMALREIRMLKKLRHENLVTMIEVFRYRKRFYLVFEYVEGTVLDELEKMPGGLGDDRTRERIYQVTRAINFCHSNHIIHRDVKPENVLVSSLGVVKLCDFGFARLVSVGGEPCTEYVATRWYRAPELLVGEQHYGAPVDVWAIGCLFAEMMTGDPLFPGDSDIDQLYLIVRMIGKPCSRHQHIMAKSSQLRGMIKSAAAESNGLYRTFSNWSLLSLDFLISCMKMDPQCRPTAEQLLRHNYFSHDRFPQKFLPALREKVMVEFNANPLLRKFKVDILMSTDRRDEIRQRRSLQVDQPKWKISLAEGSSIKRKFSCDTVSSSDIYSDKESPINNNTTTSKHQLSSGTRYLNVPQKSGTASFLKQQHLSTSWTTNQAVGKDATSVHTSNVSTVDYAGLEKMQRSSESQTKLAEPVADQPPMLSDNARLTSATQSFKKDGSTIADPSESLPQFQSLQMHASDCSASSPPSSIRISRQIPQPFKKSSPSLVHNIRNASIKDTFSRVPIVNPSPCGQYLKKLDRNAVLDAVFMNVEPTVVGQNHLLAPSWLQHSTGHGKNKNQKKPADEFSLPIVPGATSESPNRTKKKNYQSSDNAEHNKINSIVVTPKIRHSQSSSH